MSLTMEESKGASVDFGQARRQELLVRGLFEDIPQELGGKVGLAPALRLEILACLADQSDGRARVLRLSYLASQREHGLVGEAYLDVCQEDFPDEPTAERAIAAELFELGERIAPWRRPRPIVICRHDSRDLVEERQPNPALLGHYSRLSELFISQAMAADSVIDRGIWSEFFPRLEAFIGAERDRITRCD